MPFYESSIPAFLPNVERSMFNHFEAEEEDNIDRI
jgi:hypothetical protein